MTIRISPKAALRSDANLIAYCADNGIEITTEGRFGEIRMTATTTTDVGGERCVTVAFTLSGHDADDVLCRLLTAMAWQGRWELDSWTMPLVELLNDDGDIRL